MIRFVCPACGRSLDRVRSTMLIKAIGYLRVMPGGESGITHAINSPSRVPEGQHHVDVIPEGNLTCGKCGKEFPLKRWKYLVSCNNCGELLEQEPTKDPSELVNAHICRDTKNIYCRRCWKRSSKDYCPGCRFREDCIPYNNI